MMPNPILIIVSGPAATGKTYMAQKLAQKFTLPVFGKDDFKEMMYDQFDQIELSLTRKLGKISILNLEILTKALISKNVSLIIEANFDSQLFSPFLKDLKNKYNFSIIEVNLYCDGNILLERFIKRENSGEKHPGHQGIRFLEVMRSRLLKGKTATLAVDSYKFEIDTSDFAKIDYKSLFHKMEQIMK